MKIQGIVEKWSLVDKTLAGWLVDYVAPKFCSREPDGSIQCHYAVGEIKSRLKLEFPDIAQNVSKDLKFINWDESKWSSIGKILTKDEAWKKFRNPKVKELLIDIADGSVNGHSFMKYKGGYIDPYLSSIRVNQSTIDKVDSYLEKIYRKHGIKPLGL